MMELLTQTAKLLERRSTKLPRSTEGVLKGISEISATILGWDL